MESSINTRLEKLIKSLNMNTNSFSKEIDVKPTVIYNIIKGRNKPSFLIIDKIISKFDVSPDWLVTGEGPIFKTGRQTIGYQIPDGENLAEEEKDLNPTLRDVIKEFNTMVSERPLRELDEEDIAQIVGLFNQVKVHYMDLKRENELLWKVITRLGMKTPEE